MSKAVSQNDGYISCGYRWTDTDGHTDSCRQVAKCPICGNCSRIIDEKETGHCTGHLGLSNHFLATVPNRGTV
jgi:hypothetical protein